MKRTLSRIKAMIRLYQFDLLKSNDNLDTFDELLGEYQQDQSIDDENSNVKLDKIDVNNIGDDEEIIYDKKFSDIIYLGVLQNQPKIDRQIAINLDNYPLDRLSYVDRALLRIGTYELMFTDTPTPIIINEIVNLSKQYSEIDKIKSSKFNNAVLDKISKEVRK